MVVEPKPSASRQRTGEGDPVLGVDPEFNNSEKVCLVRDLDQHEKRTSYFALTGPWCSRKGAGDGACARQNQILMVSGKGGAKGRGEYSQISIKAYHGTDLDAEDTKIKTHRALKDFTS